jgi:(R,R)-butanediol dehydrogenase/meso-butanediol dehydrogenase/diacetyl reductase
VADALGGAPDIVFECAGKSGLIDQCIRIVRPRGTVVVLGLCTVADRIDLFLSVNKEVRLQMSAFYTLVDFETAATPLDVGHVSPRAMITDQIDLASLPATFEQLRHRSTQCKVLVRPNAPSMTSEARQE